MSSMDRTNPAPRLSIGRQVGPAFSQLLAAIRLNWRSLPGGWRWVWLGLPAMTTALFVRSLWVGLLPEAVSPEPACFLLLVIGGIGIASRVANSAWLLESPWRLPGLLSIIAFSALLILAAAMPRMSAFSTGCVMAVAAFSLGVVGGWAALATDFFSVPPDVVSLPRPAPLEVENESQGLADDRSWVSHWTRRIDGADDVLEGAIRVRFAPRENLSCIHIPFSPPFAGVPTVDCEVLADADVRTRLAAVYPYGARIELRQTPDGYDSATVELQVSARYSVPHP